VSAAPDASATVRPDAGPAACAGGFRQDEERAQIALPEIMTSRYAPDLAAALKALRGRPITLDASSVRQIGTLCLQVLISARQTWKSDGHDFRMSGAPEEMTRRWTLFGLPTGEIAERAG
jgi:chemotaxis protein CheX